MAAHSASYPSPVSVLWPEQAQTEQKWLRLGLLAVVGAALVAVSAHIQVPFYPVPVSLQTLVVFLIGIAYGPRLGMSTLGLYLIAGTAGLPVFTNPLGVAGPTGGYLVGFFLAAGITGWAAERAPNIVAIALAVLLAEVVIMGLGVLQLGEWFAANQVDASALEAGLYPFIYGDILKMAIAIALAMAGRHVVRRWIERNS